LSKALETFLLHRIRMKRSVLIGWVLLAATSLVAAKAHARQLPAASIPAPSALCRAAILQAERGSRVPDRLLDSIAVVESGKRDPVSGAIYPWPWTINAEGIGHWYDSKAEAIAAVQALQARGVRSIDVGCMQVNLSFHPDAFASLDMAFDPMTNAAYGAKFLQQLFNQTNAWPLAVAAYHSFTPELGADYAKKVLAAWGVPELPVGSQTVTNGKPVLASAMSPNPLGGGSQPGRVAVMVPTGNEAIRVMPMTPPVGMGGAGAIMTPPRAGQPTMTARGLDAYRAMPIAFAGRSPRLF
jgi:hypothetical protein